MGPASGEDETDLKTIIARFDSLAAEEATVSRNLEDALAKLRSLA